MPPFHQRRGVRGDYEIISTALRGTTIAVRLAVAGSSAFAADTAPAADTGSGHNQSV